MGLRIATNLPSINAQRTLNEIGGKSAKSLARLSSGDRIVDAGDDAAGLAIANNLQAQVKGMQQAQRNANDGISMVQTAEGSMNEVSNILIRLRELGVQAASDTVGEQERGFIETEFQELKSEIDRIANSTEFNGNKLLNGEGKSDTSFQVGIFAGEENTVTFNSAERDIRADNLGIGSASVLTRDDASESLAGVDESLNKLNSFRAELGAVQNRLQSASRNLGVTVENLSTARSRVADTDIAKETSELVKNNILENASISVLAQANAQPKNALRLIG